MPLSNIILVASISVNLLITGLRCINRDSGEEKKNKRKEKICIVTRIEKNWATNTSEGLKNSHAAAFKTSLDKLLKEIV